MPYQLGSPVQAVSRRFQTDDVLLLAEHLPLHELRKILDAIPNITADAESLVVNRGERAAILRFQVVVEALLYITRLRLAQPVVVGDSLKRRRDRAARRFRPTYRRGCPR